MAQLLGREWAQTHESVHARLALQCSICIRSSHLDRHALDAFLLTKRLVKHRKFPSSLPREAAVHAQQHGCPILGVHAARSRLDGQERDIRFVAEHLEPTPGLEPGTYGLRYRCSTVELGRQAPMSGIRGLNPCL